MAFGVPDPPPLTPRYNVAPSQLVVVVGLKPDGVRRGMAQLPWRLVAHSSETIKPKYRPINVRAEGVLWNYGLQYRERRCLVPADGFYEWTGPKGKKTPYRFTMADGKPFAFAGLWDLWRGAEGKLVSCCILTTAANDLIRPYHDRMPVIVPAEAYDAWLAPDTPERELLGLLRPYPPERMAAAEAGRAVNSVKYDGPECLAA